MDDDAANRASFERFADTGAKHAFRLRSGVEFLGWILDVGDDAVLVAWAPSPLYAQATGGDDMAPPDAWIRFDEIDPTTLASWDGETRRWIAWRP